jgi:hydroxymethylpyrimidine/phosphomethylpyrimidine kinase
VERVTPVVLAVGTTHPLNIAGLGLDARVASTLGIRLVTVVAGVSAQDGTSLLACAPIDDETIAAQFAALHDIEIGAIHVGALVSPRSAAAVAAGVARLGVAAICDPVIATTAGERLADDATVAVLHDRVFGACTLVTPNLAELAYLVRAPIRTIAEMERGARALLRSSGTTAVLVKGGHLEGRPTDVLVTPTSAMRFASERIETSLRGTGDLLACGIAASLAHGEDVPQSIRAARAFVQRSIASGISFAGARTIP